MLSYQGGVKLIDFGIAKAKILTTETRAGVIKGKYSYMSPEQALGKDVDGRSDIFSFGVVLYEMATGQPAFPGDTSAAIRASRKRPAPKCGMMSQSAAAGETAPTFISTDSAPSVHRRAKRKACVN